MKVSQPQSRTLECKNLHDYLKTLQGDQLDSLYNHPATCLAVFRELPPLAKQIVMRLIFVQQAVPQAVVSSWVTAQFQADSQVMKERLTSLKLWSATKMPGGLEAWLLNGTFRANLRLALSGGGQPWTMSAYLEPDPRARDVEFLDQYATERWDTVLHYMVASTQQAGISADAVRTLLQAGLMSPDESQDNSPVITRAGFQFLLMERSSQVWFFMLQYLDSVATRGMSLVECLAFLFQLSFSQLGKDYSTDGMSNNLMNFVQHLREFGLLYQRRVSYCAPNILHFWIKCLNRRLHRTSIFSREHQEGFIPPDWLSILLRVKRRVKSRPTKKGNEMTSEHEAGHFISNNVSGLSWWRQTTGSTPTPTPTYRLPCLVCSLRFSTGFQTSVLASFPGTPVVRLSGVPIQQ